MKDQEAGLADATAQDVGYATWAKFLISDRSGHSTTAFRRFDELAVRNLLKLQSELAALETELVKADAEDFANVDDLDIVDQSADFTALQRAADDSRPDDDKRERARARLDLFNRIETKMAAYQDALIRYSTLIVMRRPSRSDFETIQWRFRHARPQLDQVDEILQGSSRHIYRDRGDLVSPGRGLEEDRMFQILRRWFPRPFRTTQPTIEDGVFYASENAMRWTSTCISIVLSAFLLYGAILTFYYVRKPHVVLGLIVLFTSSFALMVGLITNASRAEIFASAAAYAAVVVVFISSPLGN